MIVGVAGLAAGLAVGALVLDSQRPGRFRKRGWLEVAPEDDDRLVMADDLIKRGRLKNMTRAAVQKLLGAATPTDRFPGALAYRLGLERSYMPVDFEWLVIQFDGGDRVTQYWIATD
ncbi:hypothetical protein CSW64_07090 [Caulobacter mirabilis]|uniref:Uncharacterized protein n=1 Tax=Caulobacter mirabilis TaxID=69666 RepID=A0A2D2AW31_9CAUL|nr:hypothetical protein CSW64_07090 [Caulobacter mirabilis]